MSGILITDHMIKATLESFKHLVIVSKSEELNKPVRFGVVSKPLKFWKPHKKRSLDFSVRDPLFFIGELKVEERKYYKNLFKKGEYCQLADLKSRRQEDKQIIDEIDFLDQKGFF